MQAGEVHQAAATLLGKLAHSGANKGAIRSHNGISSLLKVLERPNYPRQQKEAIIKALTAVIDGNEVNQDYARYAFGSAHCNWF